MHNYYLTVIKNEKGMNDYDYGQGSSPDLETMILPAEEFEHIAESGFWHMVNVKYDLLIDEFESEVIPGNIVDGCMELFEESGLDKEGTFFRALAAAKDGVALALDF